MLSDMMFVCTLWYSKLVMEFSSVYRGKYRKVSMESFYLTTDNGTIIIKLHSELNRSIILCLNRIIVGKKNVFTS